MDALENQLKEARFLAEEADKKYDEVNELQLLIEIHSEHILLNHAGSTSDEYFYDDEGLYSESPILEHRKGCRSCSSHPTDEYDSLITCGSVGPAYRRRGGTEQDDSEVEEWGEAVNEEDYYLE